MKNLILAAFLVLGLSVFSGCSIFKKRAVDVNKTSFSQNTEGSVKVDSTNKKTDKTVTIETESADTVVSVPGVKVSTSTELSKENLLNSLVKGMTLVNNSAVIVKTQLDTLTGKLNTSADIKPRDVPVKINKTKATYNDKTEEAAVKKDEHNKTSIDQKSKTKSTVAEPKGLGWLWGIVIGVVAIITGGIIFYFWNKRPKK